MLNLLRCISFDSYIKPQLKVIREIQRKRCISFDSYIKPQLITVIYLVHNVVYLLIPTSNHNSLSLIMLALVLYIF